MARALPRSCRTGQSCARTSSMGGARQLGVVPRELESLDRGLGVWKGARPLRSLSGVYRSAAPRSMFPHSGHGLFHQKQGPSCAVSSTQKGSQGCHCRTSSVCVRTNSHARLCWIKCSLWFERGGGTIRENPTNSLHWHRQQEKRLKETAQCWETEYDSWC